MATSGTTAFNPSIDEVIEEAYERTNVRGTRTGYQLRSARRSLNILLSEWGNRGVNLWKIKLASVPLVEGQPEYNYTAVLMVVWSLVNDPPPAIIYLLNCELPKELTLFYLSILDCTPRRSACVISSAVSKVISKIPSAFFIACKIHKTTMGYTIGCRRRRCICQCIFTCRRCIYS